MLQRGWPGIPLDNAFRVHLAVVAREEGVGVVQLAQGLSEGGAVDPGRVPAALCVDEVARVVHVPLDGGDGQATLEELGVRDAGVVDEDLE